MDSLDSRSVLLVTLDSCRYDTARDARLFALSSLGPLQRAESPGTYTLAAHAALFNGFLPRPVDGFFEVAGRRTSVIWRSKAARPGAHSGIEFSGPTIMEHYSRRGFRVLGAGGVTFFDPSTPCNALPPLFAEFHYYGRPAESPTGPDRRIVDREESLPLAHVDELAERCLQADRFFCFINCSSTHIPYTSPAGRLTEQSAALLARLYRLHDAKASFEPESLPFSPAETAVLLDMQRRALEWADSRLGRLFNRLAHRSPLVVVCGDHGDEFGEGGRYGHGHPHPTVTTVPLWSGLLSPG